MKTLKQYIAEAKKKNFGALNKRFYVIKDPYYSGNINILAASEVRFLIDGANGDDEDWDMYEDFDPEDILYSTNEIKDAVNWVLKYKKIDPKKFLNDLWEGNEDCNDPFDYEDNGIGWDYKLHDSDRFFWAVLTDHWKNKDIDGKNN